MPMISRSAAPGKLLVSGQRGMPEVVAVWLRGLLLTFPHLAALDDDVVVVLPAVDLDGPELE